MLTVGQRVEVFRLDASRIPVFPEMWEDGTVTEVVTGRLYDYDVVVRLDKGPIRRMIVVFQKTDHPYLRVKELPR